MGNSIHPKRTSSKARLNKGPWKEQAQKERRKIAEERQAKRNKLTPQQQLDSLDRASFAATKERTKLLKQISVNK